TLIDVCGRLRSTIQGWQQRQFSVSHLSVSLNAALVVVQVSSAPPRRCVVFEEEEGDVDEETESLITSSTTRFAALPFDLSPPPIDHDLLETVTLAGAKVSDDGIIETFDNDVEALDAVDNGVVVVDLSHFGRIRVSGEDRIQFLHNQSTANFECLREGQVRLVGDVIISLHIYSSYVNFILILIQSYRLK
ncbi:hypothetical protein SLA2020_413150, partial [Shorea laevis]